MVSFGCWYWYEKAAKQGHAAAQFNLGECYENGYGVPQDVSKAKYWMEKAAKQGFVKAKEALEQLKWYIDKIRQNKQNIKYKQMLSDLF